ncbi:MAG: prepilin-type N-terminal cleavage/methylation domain-containing protein [Phycisphaerales bacterium]|nr:prepilin-type N-terminal cleavage/methylation domain-containing protein [Phycisphaerales bacterium]
MTQRSSIPARAFTLIELVVVVVIIGILAAIAIPRMTAASERARFTSTLASFKVMEGALDNYFTNERAWPVDEQPGIAPPALAAYLQASLWTKQTPLGGAWDWNGPGGASPDGRVNISIFSPEAGKAGIFCRFDHDLDDNDCGAGTHRADEDRSFKIIE